ncbi:MAG: hypothetical protein U5R49_05650 [Deltaproteobacteria bacterium]|nr:hypothetical protein [Deltaproteobacteria bacterium]
MISACGHPPDARLPSEDIPEALHDRDRPLGICTPCTRYQAGEWARRAKTDPWSGLKAANCYAFLITKQAERTSRLADAQKGRQLAEQGVAQHPESGLAHYLYAYLTGLEAENDPLRGLEWVPVIEREALRAANLSPGIDHGGPDRMLGELYLRAPAFPMSVGDPAKSITHFKKAVTQAPGFMENRLGLVEALLTDDQQEEACRQLIEVWRQMPPKTEMTPAWTRGLKLMKRLCNETERH